MRRLRLLSFIVLPAVAGCAGSIYSPAVNLPGKSVSELKQETPLPRDSTALDKTLVSLSFSGGGMRASAFSYGVLDAMHDTPIPHSDKKLTDAVDVVTGVSGGSVTAAYYAWKHDDTFPAFHSAFLEQNAEAGLSTRFSPNNILRVITFGGVNDNSAFPVWLNRHLFHGATYGDLEQRPILWISASDIINRTPFVFSGLTFAPLCSDLSKVRLADAVAASAAVPGAFTPINLESYADRCDWQPNKEYVRTSAGSYGLETTAAAFKSYRDVPRQRYLKLLDGGLTDNFGVQGLAQVRLVQSSPYAPIHPDRAIRLKNALFMVVNSGRSPTHSEWSTKLRSPGVIELAGMVTDTAIDANVRSTYDLFRLVMLDWRNDLVKWRCSLPREKVKAALPPDYGPWKCDDVHFYVTQVSFSDAGPDYQPRLDAIETRFVLPPEQIDLLVNSAKIALQNDTTYQEFLRRLQ